MLSFFTLIEREIWISQRNKNLKHYYIKVFRQFQTLSEETWSRAAYNAIELCFYYVHFLATQVGTFSY